jgi:integrase
MAKQNKRKRSVHGGGSVYRRESDGRWVASFIVEETGKRQYLYADKDENTQQNAYKKLQGALFEQRQGKLATGPQQTVEQFLRDWLEKTQKLNVRASTYHRQETIIRKHILPAVGHLQLRKLTPLHIRNLYAAKMAEGLKPSTIRTIHAAFRHALDDAYRWKLIPQNVCDQVSPPATKKRKVQILTLAQAIHLLKICQSDPLEAFVTLALTTGMRHGEMAALRWDDINFEDRSLRIERTVQRMEKRFVEGEPKTLKSAREIMLPQITIEALQRHKVAQQKIRMEAGDRWQERDLVFCDKHGNFIHAMTTLLRFYRLLDKAGLPRMRIHDLRHTASTLLILVMRQPDKLVQELLGHESLEMTEGLYTHAERSMLRQMMDEVNTFFSDSL